MKFKVIKILLLFVVLTYSIFAQGYTDGVTIRHLKFVKPKRTLMHTLYNIIYPVKEGSRYYKDTKDEIIGKLHDAGIFTPDIKIEESFEDNYVDLTITVVDKWTLLGAPMFSFSSTSWFAGLALFDMNLLGTGKMLSLMGRYGNRGWYGSFKYIDPYFIVDRLSADISFYAGENYTTDYNIKTGEYIREYQNLYIKGIINYGFKIVDEVKLVIGVRYELNDYIKNQISEVYKMQHIGINYGFVWQDTKYQYPFTKGFKVLFDASYNIALNNSSTNYFQGFVEINYAYVFAKRNRVGFFLGTGLSDAPAQREFRLGSVEGTFILPNAIVSAKSYNSLFAFYEIFLFDIKWKKKSIVAFSLQPFYEVGRIQNDITGSLLYHGPGAGIIIYPSVISGTTASIGFRVGWDLENKDFNFIFSGSRSF